MKLFIVAFILFISLSNLVRADGEKSPVGSCFLSLVIPGLGQYYNGTDSEIVKGVIQTVGTYGLIFYNNVLDPSGISYERGYLILISFAGCYLWSIIDAPIASADINGEISKKKRAASDFNIRMTLLNDSALRLIPATDISLRF